MREGHVLRKELVVFRDRSGAVGLLELHCPDRDASLEFRGDLLQNGSRREGRLFPSMRRQAVPVAAWV
jgi:hypothetical protein